MRRRELCLELVPHLVVCHEVVALARQKARDCYLVILIRLYSELSPMVAIGNERLVELLNREGKREVFRMPVADIAHQAMKNSI